MTDRKTTISRAPDPITPISGGIGSALGQPDRANWEKWKHMISVPLWHAVALSLDIEPDPGRPFDHYPDEFSQRLAVAINHAENQKLAATTENAHGTVKIDDFVRWAAYCTGWDLPPEMCLPKGSPRGPRPRKQDEVARGMRGAVADSSISIDVLRSMKEVEMEARFGASRDTCRKARKAVLSEFDTVNSDN